MTQVFLQISPYSIAAEKKMRTKTHETSPLMVSSSRYAALNLMMLMTKWRKEEMQGELMITFIQSNKKGPAPKQTMI